jgi:hypothetical protein
LLPDFSALRRCRFGGLDLRAAVAVAFDMAVDGLIHRAQLAVALPVYARLDALQVAFRVGCAPVTKSAITPKRKTATFCFCSSSMARLLF